MRVTATLIHQWADRREAQGMLPVLVRRLIVETARLTELAMPGGDSVSQPGWDGILTTTTSNAWVPHGPSRWEIGCDKRVGPKADREYKKRTQEHGHTAASSTFVFVTPRRWPGKSKWRDGKLDSSPWRQLRVLDANDLETWLESAPATALWFGELLGLSGSGIESVEKYWDTWRSQSRICLGIEAISLGREAEILSLQNAASSLPPLLAVEADSTEEAVAFVCAQLLAQGHATYAACVTSVDGWRYVDANPHLTIFVASTIDVAAARAPRDGQMLIVPTNVGERTDHLEQPRLHRASDRISLPRPRAERFEKSLVEIGENEADAARYARSTGRSWSVYRRLTAANPAIAHPAWLKDPRARVLIAIVLVGGWDGSRPGDVALLEEITGRRYEDLERELRHLAVLDDSPVLKIGSIWKAKAPLELLYLYAREISNQELERYFATVEAVLMKPDPALELDPDKRWMAAIYGKVRNESGIVIKGIVDALAKLGAYGEATQDDRITSSVDTVVSRLLRSADGERWLSLSGALQGLAEASPNAFLSAIEASLGKDSPSIARLFLEQDDNPAFGRNWHVTLLWALEILAWSPRHLGRVTQILARLCRYPVRHNLANRPMRTLSSLFRPWWPQTTASLQMRTACLARVVEGHDEAGWELLIGLLPSAHLSASANEKPHWRDDDAGAPGPSMDPSVRHCYEQVTDLAIARAKGRAQRIATLLKSLDNLSDRHSREVVEMAADARTLPTVERQIVRDSVREYLNWHNTYNHDGDRRERTYVDELRTLFDALAPDAASERHVWLFSSGWVDLPDGRAKDHHEEDAARLEARRRAISEVFEQEGWAGLTKMSEASVDLLLLGWSLAQHDLTADKVLKWSLKRFLERGGGWHDPLMQGVFNGLNDEMRPLFISEALASLPPASIAPFLSAGSWHPSIWSVLQTCSEDVQTQYWSTIKPAGYALDGAALHFLVSRLMSVGRHRTAFETIYVNSDRGDPAQLLELLQGIAAGQELDGPLPGQWHIEKAVERIAAAAIVGRQQLARLEFAYFDALHHGASTPHLMAELLSNPEAFIECIALTFKPANGPAEPMDESLKHSAQVAWSILHTGKGVPGKQSDGTVDPEIFEAWVAKVRERGAELDRRAITDVCIGQWLSACPADPDGTWPCLPVRQLLEHSDAGDIRQGFNRGIHNNRGVHSRGPDEGGAQERDLAADFRSRASLLAISHPMTAAVLEDVARTYDRQAHRQDDDASLVREGIW